MQEYLPVMEMMYTKYYMRSAYLLEQKEAYANCEKVKNLKLPEDLPAVFKGRLRRADGDPGNHYPRNPDPVRL